MFKLEIYNLKSEILFMFEGTPPNLPTLDEKVEDIFAPVEPVKPTPPPTGGVSPAPPEGPRTGFKRLLIIIVGVLVLGGVGWAGYVGWKSTRQAAKIKPASKTEVTVPTPTISAPVKVVPTPSPVVPEIPTPVETPSAPVDTDGDGLTDAEEAELGTNAQNVDSDNDALSDREEVKVYKSNPLNSDTDGDSYLDGHEVKNNYSPTGPGKLLPSVPAQ